LGLGGELRFQRQLSRFNEADQALIVSKRPPARSMEKMPDAEGGEDEGKSPSVILRVPVPTSPSRSPKDVRFSEGDHTPHGTGSVFSLPSQGFERLKALYISPLKWLARTESETFSELERDPEPEPIDFWKLVAVKGPPLLLVLFIMPVAARTLDISPHGRCLLILLGVLVFSLFDVMPLFCLALFIPVLGSLCRVFGEDQTMTHTSMLLLGNFFNSTSFLVLGSFVINSVFEKCGVLDKMMRSLLRRWNLESKEFLLVMMLSTMTCCSVLVSGSIVVLAAIKPYLMSGATTQMPVNVTKRLLLGVAFAANTGSTLLPISSTVNLILVSLLKEFDHELSLWRWVFMAAPVAILATLGSWWILMHLFPSNSELEGDPQMEDTPRNPPTSPTSPKLKRSLSVAETLHEEMEMSQIHWFFLAAAGAVVLGITVFAEVLEPVVGSPAILSLGIVVLVFGSGFMTREEFLTLDWDLLAIVGGTNVMAMMVRETALAAQGLSVLSKTGLFGAISFWPLSATIVVSLMAFSTVCSHSLSGVIVLPLLVALGVKLHAAEFLAMLCALAIPFGMGSPSASFDNVAAQTVAGSLGRRRCVLTHADYATPGIWISMIASILIMTLGFGVGYMEHGMPKSMEVASERTPEELNPKVVKENRVHDRLEGQKQSLLVRRIGEGLHSFGWAKRRKPSRAERHLRSPGGQQPVLRASD